MGDFALGREDKNNAAPTGSGKKADSEKMQKEKSLVKPKLPAHPKIEMVCPLILCTMLQDF